LETETPVAPQSDAPSPSAPPEAAADTSVTTIERGGVTTHEFRNPDAAPREAAPEPAKTESEGKAPDVSVATPKPEGDGTEADDLTPEELKRFEKSKAAQARIEQLAANRSGNLLQREREKLRAEVLAEHQKEQEAWRIADEGYQLLTTRGREAFMAEFRMSERDAAQWEANYLAARETRGQDQGTARQADETFALDFNNGAITEFKAAASQLLPFYGELPDETRAKLDGLKFDPNGNWLGEAFEALAKGVAARDARIDREHKAALDEARAAGANRANAEREESAPVIVDSRPNDLAAMSRTEIYEGYASGKIDRATYHAELRRRGIDY